MDALGELAGFGGAGQKGRQGLLTRTAWGRLQRRGDSGVKAVASSFIT